MTIFLMSTTHFRGVLTELVQRKLYKKTISLIGSCLHYFARFNSNSANNQHDTTGSPWPIPIRPLLHFQFQLLLYSDSCLSLFHFLISSTLSLRDSYWMATRNTCCRRRRLSWQTDVRFLVLPAEKYPFEVHQMKLHSILAAKNEACLISFTLGFLFPPVGTSGDHLSL